MQAQGRRPGRWDREEGKKVANFLREKSLMKTSTSEGRVQVKVNNIVMKKGYTATIIADIFAKTGGNLHVVVSEKMSNMLHDFILFFSNYIKTQ